MSRGIEDAAALVRIVSAAYAASQARLGALVRREAELRETLAELQGARVRSGGDDGSDPARRAGADLLWQRWVDGRRDMLNRELAQVLAGQARARAALARDFGRDQAIRGLHDRLVAEARTARSRRAERDGRPG